MELKTNNGEKHKKPLQECLRSIFELENLLKNTFVLVVNYENELYRRSIVDKYDIEKLDLDFKELQEKVLLLHNEVMSKIKKNSDIIENKEVK